MNIHLQSNQTTLQLPNFRNHKNSLIFNLKKFENFTQSKQNSFLTANQSTNHLKQIVFKEKPIEKLEENNLNSEDQNYFDEQSLSKKITNNQFNPPYQNLILQNINISNYSDDSDDEEYSIWEEGEQKEGGISNQKSVDITGNQLHFYQIYRIRSVQYQDSYVSRFDTAKEVLKLSSHFQKKLSINTIKQQQMFLDQYYSQQKQNKQKKTSNNEAQLNNNQVKMSQQDQKYISQTTSSQNKDLNSKRHKQQIKNNISSAVRQVSFKTQQSILYQERKNSLELFLNNINSQNQIIIEENKFSQSENNSQEQFDNNNLICDIKRQSIQSPDTKSQSNEQQINNSFMKSTFSIFSYLKQKIFF